MDPSRFATFALTAGALLATSACLQRPVGTDQPKTTNVIVDNLQQDAVDKIDLLFMIDNSLSMGDKQALLARALPDLVNRLVDPVCVSETGATEPAVDGECAPGWVREFQPIDDIHIGVITSSLGGYGAEFDCVVEAEGDTDGARLLGSLARVQGELPGTPDFLRWCRPGSDRATRGECTPTAETSGGDAEAFSDVFANQVRAAREQGCGWEASLEAWVRFLIDPAPYARLERQDCPFGNDASASCIGPERDPDTGLPRVDTVLMAQRAAFLRPDSLLAVVMLTDENDCSFKPTGQSWRLARSKRPDADGEPVSSHAYRGAGICQTAPNDRCCVSCGAAVPEGCPTTSNADGETVSAGCEEPFYALEEELGVGGPPSDDPVNLRCYDQKRRFGVDYLFPVARYRNALEKEYLCPLADDLDPEAVLSDGSPVCGANQELLVPNPLYQDLGLVARQVNDPGAARVPSRTADLVFLAGIVGVPWQALAVDPDAPTLEYRSNDADDAPNVIDWVPLLGSAEPGTPYDLMARPPTNPLMWEQIDPRSGTDPTINGGEWNILDRNDLQYACTFPLDEPVRCPSQAEIGTSTVGCDCTYYGEEGYENPLCQGLLQTHAKAYPSIRPLQVLRDYGANSIVASICPKNTTDPASSDFGYRPAIAAIVDRLSSRLTEKCLPRKLEVREVEGGVQASCQIVEADLGGTGCDLGAARDAVSPAVAKHVRERLERTNWCTDADGDCHDYQLCSIQPLAPGTPEYRSCLESDTANGNGWCYVAPDQGLGDARQVEQCPATEKRKIRFVGKANPRKGSVTFFACAGAPQGGSSAEL